MNDKLKFLMNRLGERLWVKPVLFCLVSIAVALLAKTADVVEFLGFLPDISSDSVEKLLTVMSSSMLVIAVFAVGSMLAAYESAARSATPRTFTVVVSDDRSQNALSTFVGAFIFSIVGLVAVTNGYYEKGGIFSLLIITLIVFALVILNFLKWVDAIARLGRLGNTVSKVEAAAESTLRQRGRHPTLGARKAFGSTEGVAVTVDSIGYVQHIDVAALQAIAKKGRLQIEVAILPGCFKMPDQPVAYLRPDGEQSDDGVRKTGEGLTKKIGEAFVLGDFRTFDEDPRFGLIVMSEIASRALSPAVNDPGTAIGVIDSLVRLFVTWVRNAVPDDSRAVEYDRVLIPELSLDDMFEDAFSAIARDGAKSIEVMIRLQKALAGLAELGDAPMRKAARDQSGLAFRHAKQALPLASDVERLQEFVLGEGKG
ncbi:DUF2254 domain-containing protein [Marinobacter sp. F4206]|nr:DUF2254 domain-containing protein [Marinobacter sp. F4206]